MSSRLERQGRRFKVKKKQIQLVSSVVINGVERWIQWRRWYLVYSVSIMPLAWVKVFRIMPDFRIFRLWTDHFCETCKSVEIFLGGGGGGYPLNLLYDSKLGQYASLGWHFVLFKSQKVLAMTANVSFHFLKSYILGHVNIRKNSEGFQIST